METIKLKTIEIKDKGSNNYYGYLFTHYYEIKLPKIRQKQVFSSKKDCAKYMAENITDKNDIPKDIV